jgi:hypothetical protein
MALYRSALLALALLLPLSFVSHAEDAVAASSAAPFSAAAPVESERALCEWADAASADGPGACGAAASGEVAVPADAVPADAVPADAVPADAAPSDAAAHAAPMCDNAAASIAAVPEVPEIDRGQFEPARCDMQRLLALLRSDERAGNANVISGGGTEKPAPTPNRLQQERLDAASSGGLPWPAPSAPSIVAFEAPRGLGWQRGHSERIDRPPSQR